MRQLIAAAAAAGIIFAGAVDLQARRGPGAVRPEDRAIRKLMARGVERSTTFRDLIAQLAASDVVAYVRFARCAGRVPSCLLWASSAPGMRRVLIRIDR